MFVLVLTLFVVFFWLALSSSGESDYSEPLKTLYRRMRLAKEWRAAAIL